MYRLTLLLALVFSTPRPTIAQVVRRDSGVAVAIGAAHQQLMESLRVAHHGRTVSLPPFYRVIQAEVERRVGLRWLGPAPRVIVADVMSDAVACDGARCDGRLESLRLIDGADSLVAVVVVLADHSLLDERVWHHELTHALLMQHGLVAESVRHDARWFPRSILAQR